jgi:hypothetical protein
MGFAVEDVFGFEYIAFVNDLAHSATSRLTFFVFESLVFFFPIFLCNIIFESHGFKMFYMRLLKLEENTQSIIDLEAAHRYLCSLEGTPTLHT